MLSNHQPSKFALIGFLYRFFRRTFSIAGFKLSGFTLIETLVAITILVLAITGPLTLAQRGIDTALIASDQVTATYLAQDAIEYVRYVRDSNCLQGFCTSTADWLQGLDGIGIFAGQTCASVTGKFSCAVDSTKPIMASVNSPGVTEPPNPRPCTTKTTCVPLDFLSDPNFNSSGGCVPGLDFNFYNYDCGPASKFTRIINMQCLGGATCANSNEAVLTVSVSWTDGTITRYVTLVDDLYNWQPV